MAKVYRKYEDYHRINEQGIEQKQCQDCKKWLLMDNTYFNTVNGNKDKYNHRCKICQDIYQKIYYSKTSDIQREKARKRKASNKEFFNKQDLDYYYSHREERIAKVKAYREINIGWLKEAEREWRRSEQGKEIVNGHSRNRKHKNHKISSKEWKACKKYFNNCCAYCGMPEEIHRELFNQDLHREHKDDKGSNELDNCIPSCKICNSKKHTTSYEEFYNINNPNYTEERNFKILKWCNEDYKLFKVNKIIREF